MFGVDGDSTDGDNACVSACFSNAAQSIVDRKCSMDEHRAATVVAAKVGVVTSS